MSFIGKEIRHDWMKGPSPKCLHQLIVTIIFPKGVCLSDKSEPNHLLTKVKNCNYCEGEPFEELFEEFNSWALLELDLDQEMEMIVDAEMAEREEEPKIVDKNNETSDKFYRKEHILCIRQWLILGLKAEKQLRN